MALPYVYMVATDARDLVPDPLVYAPGRGVSTEGLHNLFFVKEIEDESGNQFYRAVPFTKVLASSGETITPLGATDVVKVLRGWPLGPWTGGRVTDYENGGNVQRNRPIQSHFKDREADASLAPLANNPNNEHWRQRYQKNCAALSIESRSRFTRRRNGTLIDLGAGANDHVSDPPNLLQHRYGFDPESTYYKTSLTPPFGPTPTAVGVPTVAFHFDGFLGGGLLFFKSDPGRDIPEAEFLDLVTPLDLDTSANDWTETAVFLKCSYGIYGRKGRILRSYYTRGATYES